MKKQKNIIIRVDEEFKNRLDAVAEREFVNLSALIRDFLENWLKEKEELRTTMKIEAFFCEWEEQHEVGEDVISGCITFPVTIEISKGLVEGDYEVKITTYNVDKDGNHSIMYLSDEVGYDVGALQIPTEHYNKVTPILKSQGYEVSETPVDDVWMRKWENAIETDDHWHYEARIVSF